MQQLYYLRSGILLNRKVAKAAFISSIPVLTGYITLGIAFGVLLKTNGYGIGWAFCMSLFIYAGSLEFVGIELLTAHTPLLTVALTSLLVNARHLFYGLSMLEKYRDTGGKKPYLIFALTDETYSLVVGENLPVTLEQRKQYYFFVSLFDQIYWVTGSVLGSALGSIIPFNTEGIDFALTALFITIVTDQWLSTKNHIPALIGAVATVICLLIFGQSSFLIPSMVLITFLLITMKQYAMPKEEAHE